jgi:membrane protease subunit HflK
MPSQNDNGGGPWGGGGKTPWGGSDGRPPPNIEELLKKGQDRLRQFIPGGGGSAKGIFLAVVAVLAVWLATGFYTVNPREQGVELIFGKLWEVTGPGLKYNLPGPIGEVITPAVEAINRVDVGFRGTADAGTRGGVARDVPEESTILTGDQNIVDVDFQVQWKIGDPVAYLFNIRDPDATVKRAAESAMREVIGQTSFDDAVTVGRQQIEARTEELLQSILNDYESGILIETVQLQKSDAPGEVIDAFNDVQRARQDKDRLQNEAQSYANSIVPEARGEAEQMIQQASAYRERLIKEAEGEAQRFISVYEAYKVAPEVTKRRMFLETIGMVLGAADKILIDGPAGGQSVIPYLALPEINKRSKESSN